MKLLFLIFTLCALSIACNHQQEKLFQLVEDSGIDFNNKVVDGEVENSFYFRNYYNGGGVAIGDINNDGLADVLLTSNMGENKLYLNKTIPGKKAAIKFEDVTARSGMKQDSMWSTGVVMADVNSDGWLDIYICNSGHMKNGNRRNKLYINNHNLTFTESARDYGLDISAYTTQVSFFDYDLDGDLDCFVINNSPMPINNLGYTNRRDLPDAEWPVSDFLKGGGDHLYRNDNNHFSEVSRQAGIHGSLISFGLGVSVGDVNMDGYPDVYVANDSYERDYLYINQKDGTFKDEFEECMEQNSFSSMGADLCDVNNDGYPDIFTTDMLPVDDYRLKTLGAFDNIDLYNKRIEIGLYRQFMKNCLYINDRNGRFFETANYSGVANTDWSWGALFFDADNDGFNDIYVCNGINRDVTNLDFMDFFANDVVQNMIISGKKQSVDSVLKHIPVYPLPNKMYRNSGDLQFSDIGESWGLSQPSFSNGAAYGDLDNDGDLDLVVNNENQISFVYRNNSREQNGHGYVGVQLKGVGGNTYGIGSKIRVYGGGQLFYRELVPSRGFQSSMDYKQIIGVGTLKAVDSLVVEWPDGRRSVVERPALNAVQTVSYPGGAGKQLVAVMPGTGLGLGLLQADSTGMDKHQEDDYIDFYYERNLPELLSREGPCVSKGDVNGDGWEDVYIGGAKGQPGQLYLQSAQGWRKKEQAGFKGYDDFEETASVLFDADGDGDLDLFIGAGGNNVQPGSRELQHRLYLNDGEGNLTLDARAFPVNDMNIAVAVASDYDGDGDLDLFVGSRSVPYNYGVTPQSYLYNNDGKGHFKEVSEALNGSIREMGMVTGAVWSDLDGDGHAELVVTGEWMHTRIFHYNKGSGKLEEWKATGLEGLQGWWQGVLATDVNGDGRMDLVVGNIGENFYLRPTANEPVKLWVADFDHNGTREQFLTRTVAGRDVPVFLKREITDQFPGLKKENLRHSDYAKKSIQELFSAEVLRQSVQLGFNYCSSVVAVNLGGGKFRVEVLPQMVQLSSVKGMCAADVNGDGKADLLLGGNLFTFPPQFGRLDASYGHVLLGDGKGHYNWIEPRLSGLSMTGEIKNIIELKGKQTNYILISRNNEQPVLYKTNPNQR